LGNLDYELLEQKSLSLLNEKSKDIRLFSFLGLCYLKRNEWERFCDVFDALGQLAQKDYNSLLPARPRAKQLSFKWLGEDRFVDIIEKAAPTTAAHEHIKRLLAGLAIIKKLLDTEFPNGSPFPSRLHSAALKWEKTTEPKKQEPAPQPAVSAEVGVLAVPATASSGVAATQAAAKAVESSGPIESTKDAVEVIRKTASFLIEKEPQKAAGYRLMRSVRWDSVENAPVSEGNATKLEPPPQERRTFILSLLGKGDFKVALETAEKAFSSGPTHYWLDLQRICATAATQLGIAYANVRDAILLETALFVRRVPQIKELTYSDGTPFCDPATRDWLDTDVAAVLSTSGGATSAKNDDLVETDKREVNALISANKTDEALDFLLKKIGESGNERDNFRRRVVVASTMIAAKRADLAIYILECLCEIIDKNSLLSWEPVLAADALNNLAKAYAITANGKQGVAQTRLLEKREEIMKKLSFVDPKIAYRQKQ
jgi:type VI secretion system protein VasJ